MPQNARDFQDSITKEIDVVKDRVRHLIGEANWGEEGWYKEAILRGIIRRFLPHNLSLGTGFVTRDGVVSTQQDIIVYDNSYPLLFVEGDFVIVSPDSVKGLIEVKTRLDFSTLRETIERFERNFRDNLLLTDNDRFYGIFCYVYSNHQNTERLGEILRLSKGYINHFALGPNLFVRKWLRDQAVELGVHNMQNDFYNIYELRNLAFSYFISNLVQPCTNSFRFE